MLLILITIAAVSAAVYVWTTPLRAERALKAASLQELQQATRRDPNNPRPFYYLGLRWLQLGQPAPAEQAFRRAADLDSDDEKSWLGTAIATAADGHIQEGLGIAALFERRHPDSAAAHFTIAQFCAQQGAIQRAYDEAVTATRLDPRDGDAWRLAGEEEIHLGKLQEAASDLRRAITQNPKDWRSRIDLGNLLIQRGQFAEGTACFTVVTRLAPAEALPSLLLGKQLLSQAAAPDQIEAAHQYLQQSAQIQANNAEVNHQLGRCEMKLSHWQAARDDLEKAQSFAPADISIVSDLMAVDKQLKVTGELGKETSRQQQLLNYENEKRRLLDEAKSNPGDPQKLLDLARLCAKNGDDILADRYYRLLLARAPDLKIARQEWAAAQKREAEESPLPVASPEPTVLSLDETPMRLLLRDAGAFLAQGRYTEAQAAYLSLLTRDPRVALACEGMAQAMDAAGSKEQAVAYYEKAVSLDPRLWQAQFALAANDADSGAYSQAAQHYKQGLTVVPRNAAAWHGLGTALAKFTYQYQEAEDAFSHAVALQPRSAVFLRDLADLQAKRHELDAAEADFRRALALVPQDAGTQTQLAAFLIANRPAAPNLEEAGRLLQAAAVSTPGDPMTPYWLGRLALLRGDAKRAIWLLLHAAPNVHRMEAVNLWYSLSRAYLKEGDQKRSDAALAIADRMRAHNDMISATEFRLSIDPKNVTIRLRLARMYAQSGEFDTATKLYQDVQRQAPDNTAARTELAKLKTWQQAHRQMPERISNGAGSS